MDKDNTEEWKTATGECIFILSVLEVSGFRIVATTFIFAVENSFNGEEI